MSSIFLKIFWGYILTKLDIRIYIDIFVDPIGYYLIYTGIKQLVKDFPIGNKAKIVSFGLIFYSLPSVVIDNLTNINWIWYYHILIFLDIILVFYLFQLIIRFPKLRIIRPLKSDLFGQVQSILSIILQHKYRSISSLFYLLVIYCLSSSFCFL